MKNEEKKTKELPRVYISGAITSVGYDNAKEMFDQAKELINATGKYQAVSPMDFEEEEVKTWEQYMKKDIKLLVDCEFIYLLPNWRRSKGAVIEYDLAKALGIKTLII